jgi:hypothetical protein
VLEVEVLKRSITIFQDSQLYNRGGIMFCRNTSPNPYDYTR